MTVCDLDIYPGKDVDLLFMGYYSFYSQRMCLFIYVVLFAGWYICMGKLNSICHLFDQSTKVRKSFCRIR